MLLKKCLLCVAVLLRFYNLHGELLYSPTWGYSLDLPELWQLVDRSGNNRFLFHHQLAPAHLQIAVYPVGQIPDAQGALEPVLDQLGSRHQIAPFIWRHRTAAISPVEFRSGNQALAGWSLAVELAEQKGYLVLVCTAPKHQATDLEPLIISTLDAVFTDYGAWYETGPMTAFGWQNEGDIDSTIEIAGKRFSIHVDAVDAQASQALVEREFSLLTLYAGQSAATRAWQRYYRIIWRDSWKRLERVSFTIWNELSITGGRTAALIAADLLEWTQGFTYERDFSGSDFVNLTSTLVDRRGDCDSRSLLMALLLKQMGIDAILLVSPKHAHALVAVDVSGDGSRFFHNGTGYLMADTTSKDNIGHICATLADPADWFVVDFPLIPSQ